MNEPDTELPDFESPFFALSLDLFCVLGYDGYFKRVNQAWERTLGFSQEELRSQPFIEFVHPDDRERTLQQNDGVRSGGHAVTFENRYLCSDGTYRWLLWNSAPDPDRHFIYAVARDVTRARRAEKQRKTLLRELQEVVAEVRTLQQILPICSYCRRIRDDESYWRSVEDYVTRHTGARFSHSICPSCHEREIEPQFVAMEREEEEGEEEDEDPERSGR